MKIVDQFRAIENLAEVCYTYSHANQRLAAMLQTGETEMTENKQPKLSKFDSIDKQIEELITENQRLIAQYEQMREAVAKLRAAIAKSKKLIADWEC